MNMTEYSALFSAGKIGGLEVKNRLVMAPMVRNYADARGFVTPQYVAHIERIARGGVGTMVLEASFIRQDGKGFANQLGIHTDEVVPGLRRLVEAAHKHGAAIGPQLYHAGRQTSSAITGLQPVAPSPIADPTINESPKALTVGDIRQIVQDYAAAAGRAKEAGCDFAEIHGAHGYLITQFLSSFSNARDDEYGGSLENRMRFVSEVVQAVRDVVGPEFPVTIRISADEMVPRGLTLDESVKIAQHLEGLGIDAIHVSVGNYASFGRGYMIAPMARADGLIVSIAETIKRAVNIPVMAVGKIREPGLANDIISSGKADFIALGRSLLADPDWPQKAKDGRVEDINKCIACNQGCISRLFVQQDVWCTVNPATSREEIFGKPTPETKRRVLVAGGGPAGMAAAKIAAERGNSVVLVEEDDHLGGQLVAAAAAPYRSGWEELRRYLIREMTRLGVDVRLETRATKELAREERADAAIVAIGSSAVRPPIPGILGENVIIGRDLAEGKVTARGKVVVAGGGCAGAQIAELLADRGHDVTVVEMLGAIAEEAAAADRELLLDRLRERGVKMLTETKIMKIEKDRVFIERPGRQDELSADTVVVCLGAKPNDSLADDLRQILPHVFVVGDAREPRRVTEAMVEGAIAGLLDERIAGRLAA